jgi:aspartate/methionine/tyrosine aminotransferase
VTSALGALPGLACAMPEGAFYAWLDIRGRGETSQSFASRLLEEQGVAVVPGSAFGPSGEGYVRVTCARSWAEIDEGLSRFENATC